MVFLNAGYTVLNFPQPQSLVGRTEYEFALETPEWLPPSCIYCSDFQTTLFKIKYALWAQVVPLHAKNFTDGKKTISCFRSAKEVYLYRAPIVCPVLELKTTVTTKIGGLMGFGGSLSSTTIIFN